MQRGGAQLYVQDHWHGPRLNSSTCEHMGFGDCQDVAFAPRPAWASCCCYLVNFPPDLPHVVNYLANCADCLIQEHFNLQKSTFFTQVSDFLNFFFPFRHLIPAVSIVVWYSCFVWLLEQNIYQPSPQFQISSLRAPASISIPIVQ